VRETGRRGLPAESVLRCALLKQQRQLSYEELAFHLEDSASFRAFARLPLAWSPKKSVLHHTIAAIRAETWEAINQALLASAKQDRLESGAMVRLDSTVSAALMHEPSDSALLWDAVRVMTRLCDAQGQIGAVDRLNLQAQRLADPQTASVGERQAGFVNRAFDATEQTTDLLIGQDLGQALLRRQANLFLENSGQSRPSVQ
jgi:hypothetical protein